MSSKVDWNAVLGALGDVLAAGVQGVTRGGAHSLYDALAQREGGSPEFYGKIRNYPYGEEWVTQRIRSAPVVTSQGYRKEIEDLSGRIPYFSSLGTAEGKAVAESLREEIRRLQEEEKGYKEDLASYNKEKVVPYKETAKNAHKLLELYDLLKENNKERKEKNIKNWVSDIWRRAHLYNNELLAMNDLERIIGAKAFSALNFKEKAGTNVSQREFETIMRKFVSPTNTFNYNLGVLHEPLLTSLVHAAFSRAHESLNPVAFKDMFEYKKALGRKGFELLKKDARFLDIAREAQGLGADVVNLIAHEMLVPIEMIEDEPLFGKRSEISSGVSPSPSGGNTSDRGSPPEPNNSFTLGEMAQEIQALPREDIEILSQAATNPTGLQNLSADAGKMVKGFLMGTPLGGWDFFVRNILAPLSNAAATGIALENRELFDLPIDEAVKMVQSPQFEEGKRQAGEWIKKYGTGTGLIDTGLESLGVPSDAGTRLGDYASNAAFFAALNKSALSSGEKFLNSVGKWGAKSLGQGAISQGLQDMGVNPLVSDLIALGTPGAGQRLGEMSKTPKKSLKDYSPEELKNKWYRGPVRHRRALAQDVVRQAEELLEPFSSELKTDRRLLENRGLLEKEQQRLYQQAAEALPSRVNKKGVLETLDKRIEALESKTPLALRSSEDKALLEELRKIKNELSLEGEVSGKQLENFRQEAKLSKEYDPLLPRHEQSFKTQRGKVLEDLADEVLKEESPRYGELQEKANTFYRQSLAEREVKEILESITDTFSPAKVKNGVERLDLIDKVKPLKQVLPQQAYENLWEVANSIEDLMRKYRTVEKRMYGNQRYIGGMSTALLALPKWLKKWFMTTSYSSLLSGRYQRNWKEFLQGIEKGSPKQIEKALTDLKHNSLEMRNERQVVSRLYKIFQKHLNEKASGAQWQRFIHTATSELGEMEKRYSGASDGKEAIREMLREAQKHKTSREDK